MNKASVIKEGLRDGLPIGMGYFAVSFSLGIIEKKAGLTPIAGFLASFFTRASAGEYGGYTTILANAPYVEMVLICLITNLRYLLMNTALTQRFSKKTGIFTRILVGCCCTDEIFGITIGRDGYVEPLYVFSAAILSGVMWGAGSFCGIVAGGVLPANVVSALSVALYGMFLAVIVPAGKKDRFILVMIGASFAASLAATYAPFIGSLSSGIRTIILTVILASAAAVIKPVDLEQEDNE